MTKGETKKRGRTWWVNLDNLNALGWAVINKMDWPDKELCKNDIEVRLVEVRKKKARGK